MTRSRRVGFRSPMISRLFTLSFSVAALQFLTATLGAAERVDFSKAQIASTPAGGPAAAKAVMVLRQEIASRTGLKLKITTEWPAGNDPVIAVGLRAEGAKLAGPLAAKVAALPAPGAEGFHLLISARPRPVAVIAASDDRGVLYGVGALLRKLDWSEGFVGLPAALVVTSTPEYPMRGHQLGYRPKTNAYDAWTAEQFDQYIRELALFGSNSIELIPPVSDDERVNEHMKLPAMEMMVRMTESIHSYGLDVWLWYPNVGEDYESESGIAAELAEREEVFSKLKRVDALLVPGGDPGELHPDVFFPFMGKVGDILERIHPGAKIWVSPQAFQPTREWLRSFYAHANEKPKWLGGVSFAPWVKTSLPEMRAVLDPELKIRRYPDITHNLACQYPVRDWDLAFALTLHRESYNPRPTALKTVHNALREYAAGSITYTEGISDDVNKFVWGDQDWDPNRPVIETLRDYCRFFINSEYSDQLAHSFMALERNWEGPVAANDQIDITLRQWRSLEKILPMVSKERYRFQMGLLRAYYDAYIRRRLIYETELEMRAQDALRTAGDIGAARAVSKAREVLGRAKSEPVAPDYRKRCEELADSLFEKIGSQLTVARHGAQHRTRGAFMDGIDEPLNNTEWLADQFDKVDQLADETSRLQAIERILDRTNPGPGGFYDNMGAYGSERRIVRATTWEKDPGTLSTPRIAYGYRIDEARDRGIPLAWKNQAGVIYETPLKFHYENLDPEATYLARIVYTGKRGKRIRLVADEKFPVHDVIETWNPPVREFRIPGGATEDGRLTLTWSCGEGERGAQVSEIFLIRE